MIPHQQLYRQRNGDVGDCLRTAWASYLGFYDLADVPHFVANAKTKTPNANGWHDLRELRTWTRTLGDFDACAMSLDDSNAYRSWASLTYGLPWVLCVAYVPSRADDAEAHAIVWDLATDQCVLDPSTGQPSDSYTRDDLEQLNQVLLLVRRYDPTPDEQLDWNLLGGEAVAYEVRPYPHASAAIASARLHG